MVFKIKDSVYGEFEITEPILIDIIHSEPIQRLKKIWQHGLPEKYYIMPTFTRYDHSIGVMLLLRKLGASLEEQIAGILHDASHTAFSHVADFLFKNINESYGDNILEEILEKSELPEVLKKYNLNLKKILNKKHTLLEKEAPDLCADRLDYTLRELYQIRNKQDAIYCYNNLIVNDNEIIFGNKKSAELFAKYYSTIQREHWGSVDNMIRYELTANILKYAANKNIISLNDIHKDDQYILDKLMMSSDKHIKNQLDKIFKTINFELCENNYDFFLQKKFRYVNPKFLDVNQKVKRYSEINSKYLDDLMNEKTKHEKGYKIKLLD